MGLVRRIAERSQEQDVEEGAGRQRGDDIAEQDDGEADEISDETVRRTLKRGTSSHG